jgi:hypothetical protein
MLVLFYLNPETNKFELIPVIYLGLEAKAVLDYWYEMNNKNKK